MCDHPHREEAMVVLERDLSGKPSVWCDPCLVPLVGALLDGGLYTVASCCGHGKTVGNIALDDGRELMILPDFESARRAEQLVALDVDVHTPPDPHDPQRFDGGRPDLYRTPTPSGSRKVRTTPVDLRGDGVLWMINRSLFHPLGFALAYTPETGEFTLWGNGDEPWRFADADEDELFQAFQALLARVRVIVGGPQS